MLFFLQVCFSTFWFSKGDKCPPPGRLYKHRKYTWRSSDAIWGPNIWIPIIFQPKLGLRPNMKDVNTIWLKKLKIMLRSLGGHLISNVQIPFNLHETYMSILSVWSLRGQCQVTRGHLRSNWQRLLAIYETWRMFSTFSAKTFGSTQASSVVVQSRSSFKIHRCTYTMGAKSFDVNDHLKF